MKLKDTLANKNLKILGLTGGIASGKSAVASIFSELGIPVIDADQISRELSSPGGAAEPAILKEFGTLDRKQLRDLVFSDPIKRKKLESILHPLIREASAKKIQEWLLTRPDLKHVIYEAALLIETGQTQGLDGLIVVQAPLEQRKKRLLERDGISGKLADQILSAQTSDEVRRKAATHVIQNDGSLEDLRIKVNQLHKILL